VDTGSISIEVQAKAAALVGVGQTTIDFDRIACIIDAAHFLARISAHRAFADPSLR
jgi:hypothetical protein